MTEQLEGAIPFRPTRVTDQIAEWLRSKILRGEFAVGQLLPAERSLAKQLDVTRNTLRTALARLESEDLLEMRHGSGARVKSFREQAGLAVAVHLLELGKERELEVLRGILEIRRGLAAEAVAFASERMTPEQRAHLERLAELQSTEQDRAAFMQRDREFTRTVIRAASNLTMELMYNDTLRVIRSRPDIDELRFADLDLIRFGYQWTLDLILKGDPEQARTQMRQMLVVADEEALALLRDA